MSKKVSDVLPKTEILAQLAEEASELAQAALKLRRALDGTNPTPKSVEECEANLMEEFADIGNAVTVLCDAWFGDNLDSKFEFWYEEHALSDTRHALQHPPPVRSARRGLYGIGCRPVQRAQRPGVCALPCMVCLASGTACAAACDVQAVRVRWSGQGYTGGVYSRRPAPPGQSRYHRKNKKGSKITPTPIANLKNFPQK